MMMKTVVLFCTLLLAPWLSAAETATMLLYQQSESGFAPYPSRVLVTDAFVRMDDGSDSGDYVLFDRRARQIHNVTHEEQLIMTLFPRAVTVEPPQPIALSEEEVALAEGAPQLAGRRPSHHRMVINGRGCYEVVAVAGLLPTVVDALRELRAVLAGQQANDLQYIPADMQEPCDMARHIFHYDWPLKFGLPIREWDGHGNVIELIDYREEFPVTAQMLTLPTDYHRYSPSPLEE